MIKGLKVLAIIPARGGSKGLPRKNLLPLCGKPLIAWTIDEAKKSKYIDRIVVSTECEEIASVALNFKAEVPFLRPAHLAQDDTPGIDPVLHMLGNINEKYDYVVLLQPTSPLRQVEHIDESLEQCVFNEYQFFVSVTEVDKNPNWMFSICNRSLLTKYTPEPLTATRQVNEKLFTPNGSIYIASIKHLVERKTYFTDETFGYVMSKNVSVDIDDIIDFKFTEFLLVSRENTK